MRTPSALPPLRMFVMTYVVCRLGSTRRSAPGYRIVWSQRQRKTTLRALAGSPDRLALAEPTSAVDVRTTVRG